jgi:hypothetical protein
VGLPEPPATGTEWHDRVSVQHVNRCRALVRWSDYGCSVACSKLGSVNSKTRGHDRELPDYEAALLCTTGSRHQRW